MAAQEGNDQIKWHRTSARSHEPEFIPMLHAPGVAEVLLMPLSPGRRRASRATKHRVTEKSYALGEAFSFTITTTRDCHFCCSRSTRTTGSKSTIHHLEGLHGRLASKGGEDEAHTDSRSSGSALLRPRRRSRSRGMRYRRTRKVGIGQIHLKEPARSAVVAFNFT